MTGSVLDRTRVAASAFNRAGRSVIDVARRSPVSRWMAGVPTAYHLLILPQDLRTGDASVAVELYDGYLGLAGATAPVGSESPFTIQPPTLAWQRELLAFSWLRHLHAAEDRIAQEKARKLVSDWIALGQRAPALSRDTDIVARRAIAILSHAAFLLDGADPDFYDAVMRALSRELHALTVAYSSADGVARLRALTALLLAGLCVAEQESYLTSYLPVFCSELDRQILEDGGHITRNPSALVELLLEFLPLKQCFLSRQIEPPDALFGVLKRMPSLLRFLRLGDGSVAHFNGMGPTFLDQVSTVFAYDDAFETMKGAFAHQSQYARLAARDVVVVADAGSPAPVNLSGRAHAGCGAFEMSAGYDALIVNCGAPLDEASDWFIVSRSTAAHSTLTIDDLSSARLIKGQTSAGAGEEFLLSGPKTVKSEVAETEQSQSVKLVHDGYRERFGLVHKRRLTLMRSGEALEGHDQLSPAGQGEGAATGNAQFAIRFHLHPRVTANYGLNSNAVTLTMPNEQVWRFTAEGAEVDIEESLFFADPICLRRSLQIVLKGRASPSVSVVWRIERMASQNAPEGQIRRERLS